MRKYSIFMLVLVATTLLAAGCTKHELPREVPSSPKASWEPLPK